ncbi:MAG: aldehyde dehydrogenase family protein [Pseudomonadota bacterium]
MTGLAPEFDPLRSAWPVWAASDARTRRRLNVLAPFDREPLAQVDVADERHVNDALFTAFTLFRGRSRWPSADERLAIIDGFVALIDEWADRLAAGASHECGQPLWMSHEEIALIREDAATARAALTALDGATAAGTLVFIADHVRPLAGPARVLLTALAAGAPVIVAAHPNAPLSALRLVEFMERAGLRYGWAQALVIPEADTLRALALDARVGTLIYHGDSDQGWAWRAALGPGTGALLLHAGSPPLIVASDADQQLALDVALGAGFARAAHDRSAWRRVFVPQHDAADFAAALGARALELRRGDPAEPDTDVGVHNDPGARDALRVFRDELLAGDARRAPADGDGSVLFDPGTSAAAPLGRLIVVHPYDDLEAACHRANGLPFATHAGLIGAARADVVAEWLDAPTLLVDQAALLHRWQPSAALRRSALGPVDLAGRVRALTVARSLRGTQPAASLA